MPPLDIIIAATSASSGEARRRPLARFRSYCSIVRTVPLRAAFQRAGFIKISFSREPRTCACCVIPDESRVLCRLPVHRTPLPAPSSPVSSRVSFSPELTFSPGLRHVVFAVVKLHDVRERIGTRRLALLSKKTNARKYFS